MSVPDLPSVHRFEDTLPDAIYTRRSQQADMMKRRAGFGQFAGLIAADTAVKALEGIVNPYLHG